MMQSNRSVFWDMVKGVAILLVVIGHQIQCSCGETETFAEDLIFKFIYGFHMPLFMLISGYFFFLGTQRHTDNEIVISRLRQCVLPIAIYTIISDLIKGSFSPLSMASHFTVNLWFLWAVFFLSLVTLTLIKLPKKWQTGGGILLYVIMFCVPNYKISPHIFFMYPFFLMVFYFNKYKIFETFFDKHLLKAVFLFGFLYIMLYVFYEKETFLYWSYYSIIGKGWHQIVVDVQRTVTGICGSLFVICTLKVTFDHFHNVIVKFLSYLGRNTLQLYIISMLPFFIDIEKSFSDGNINYVLSLVSFVVVMIVSLTIIELIKRNKYTNLIFFGNVLKNKSMN